MTQLLLSLILIFYSSQLFAVDKIHQLTVVTEQLEELSHADGSGLYFDLVRKIYEPLGIKVKTIVFPYIRSVNMVKLNKADFWLGSYIKEEDFAVYPRYPYDYDQVAAMYKPELFPQFNDINSLKGKNVCWIRGYNYEHHLPIKMIKHERNNRHAAFLSLQAGRFDVFLDDFDDMQAEIEKENPDMQAFQVKKIVKIFLYPAFRGDERGEVLKNLWDKRMQEIQENGEFTALFLSYEYTNEEINRVISYQLQGK
jgi:polar amino acid transport system substrate-binding protein